jgi:hypothetical protein
MEKAVVLISKNQNIIWANFLNSFTLYDVYIVIDDESINDKEILKKQYPNCNFIHINSEECRDSGYFNSSIATGLPPVISWDKAIYYFADKCDVIYDYIWFFEDDVFFRDETILERIDCKYEYMDLLTQSHTIKNENNTDGWWHWRHALDNHPLPCAYSLICICRLSKYMLEEIRVYVEKHKKMFFIEAFFNTIALHNNMCIACPNEFKHITQGDFPLKPELVCKENRNMIFHPVKNMDKQFKWRMFLS